MRPVSAAFVLGLALAAQGQNGAAQGGAKPVFPGQIDLVRMDIVALDGSGRPVSDLKKDEIWILENGNPQEIVSFVPIRHEVASTYRAASNDVASNERDEGRLIFLVLDDANSMKTRAPFVKEAATRLVESLAPEDWVGMLWVSQKRRGALEFTKDHALVLHAIEGFAGRQTQVERWFGPDELHPGPDRFLPQQMGGGFMPAGEEHSTMARMDLGAMFDADRPFLMIKDISDQLRKIEARRRAVVYIGQGANQAHFDLMSTDLTLSAAIAAARDANVTFYTIDVSDPATRNAKGPTATERAHVGLLDAVSASTGGVTSSYSNPVEAADRVITDTSVYYLAGYSPSPSKPKEDPRRIEVKTTRPGVRLFARKTYVPSLREPPPSPRDQASRTVRDLMPVSDLSLRAFAAPFADPGQKKQQIAVVVEVSLPEPREAGAAFAESMEMTLVAAAPGKGVGASEQVSAKVTLDTETSRGFKGRYVVCGRIAVEPGQYQLRLGLISAVAGQAGSVYLDVSVPNFAAQAVSLSGLVIGQARSRDPMPVARGAAITPLLPFIPSLARDFTTEDEAWAFARVYRGKGASGGPVLVTATVTRLDNDEIAWTSSEKSAPNLDARHPGEYRVALPLSILTPGSYRLLIEAAQSGGAPSALRELDFRVTGK